MVDPPFFRLLEHSANRVNPIADNYLLFLFLTLPLQILWLSQKEKINAQSHCGQILLRSNLILKLPLLIKREIFGLLHPLNDSLQSFIILIMTFKKGISALPKLHIATDQLQVYTLIKNKKMCLTHFLFYRKEAKRFRTIELFLLLQHGQK